MSDPSISYDPSDGFWTFRWQRRGSLRAVTAFVWCPRLTSETDEAHRTRAIARARQGFDLFGKQPPF